MYSNRRLSWTAAVALAAIIALAGARPAAAASPDFDSVQWTPLGCPNADLITHDSPASADFAGSSTAGNEPAYYAFDSSFLYFRYRLSGNPANQNGFDQFSWTALMQVPAGDRFKYQYQLSLDGNTDTIQIWRNDPATAQVIDFSPLFHDDSETKLYSTAYNAGGMILARSLSDGSGHYFLDFAFPVSQLIAAGAISNAADLGQSFYFPATSTSASVYNKSHLNCPFQPYTILDITKGVQPTVAPTNTVTPVTYTLDVHNAMGLGVGVSISDVAFPAYLSNIAVDVQSTDPSATPMLVSTNPLLVQFPTLAANASATVTITADAMPGCGNPDFMNTATVESVNAMPHTASALLDVQNSNGIEICDGMDNDCDGQVDEGGSLCDDGNACTVDACNGAAGCSHTGIPGCEPCDTPADCSDDANACTTATCIGGVCGVSVTPGCEPCTVPGDCTDDGNACTNATCNAGVCGTSTIPGCEPCNAPGDCADDANACTTATCTGGICGVNTTPGCEPCAVPGDCADDHNECTTATCDGGICGVSTAPNCQPCAQPSDCADDDNACTSPTCQGSVCGVFVMPACEPCTTPSDCTDDGDACTTATCDLGVCGLNIQPACKPCEVAADCDDGHACTNDQCNEGICANPGIEACQECAVAADCNDQNPCTAELCSEGVCDHVAIEGCIRCETSADCNDDQPCTADVCGQDGSCQISAIPGCVPCTTAADCNDENVCTTDTCSNGTCGHTTIEKCGVETCDDGVDNDGDGQVDCADADCADNPLCKTEICGNCIDDDGDGLVDYEDDDCCDNTNALVINKMSLRTKPELSKNKLNLKARYAPQAPAGFNPGTQGTTLEMRDSQGNFFCEQIPFKSDDRWIKMGVFKFRDKTGLMAGGLRRGKFKIQKHKSNRVMFRTKGRKMQFRDPVGTEVTVTLAVGNQCTQQAANLRTRKGVKNGRALVFKAPKTK